MKWSVLFRIDVDDVLDIMPIEQDDEHGTDLFKTIFTDELRQLAWQLATDLSYTDEECFASTLREHIQTLSNVLSDSPEFESVGLSGFVLVPSDLLKIVSWCDAPLQQPGDNQGAETFTLQVDKLAVWNPELNDPLGLDGSLQKATDLPLSFGEPVLIVGNRKNDMFYLVRARDIVGLSRSN